MKRALHTHTMNIATLAALAFLAPLAASAADGTQAGPQSIAVLNGNVIFNSTLQAWLVHDSTVETTVADPTVGTNFRMRRAEIKVSGSVVDNTRWFLMADLAKSTDPLQDLGVGIKLLPEMEVLVGQFKAPTTAEGLDSSTDLLFPERSLVARTFGDRREIGAMATYSLPLMKISAMVSNGQGPAAADTTDNSKDISLRIESSPIDMLKVGAFTTATNFSYAEKSAHGLNARFKLDQATVRGEYVHGGSQGLSSNNFVFDAGYTLLDMVQPVVRYEMVDLGADDISIASIGANYFFHKNNMKIQAAYSLLDNVSGKRGTPTEADFVPGEDGGLFTLSFQAAI